MYCSEPARRHCTASSVKGLHKGYNRRPSIRGAIQQPSPPMHDIQNGIALNSYFDPGTSTVIAWVNYNRTVTFQADAKQEAVRQLQQQGVVNSSVANFTWGEPREIATDISWETNGTGPSIMEVKGALKVPSTEPPEPSNDPAAMFMGWNEVIWTATRK